MCRAAAAGLGSACVALLPVMHIHGWLLPCRGRQSSLRPLTVEKSPGETKVKARTSFCSRVDVCVVPAGLGVMESSATLREEQEPG